MSNKEMNKVATRIITKIGTLENVRGPSISFFVNTSKEHGITYQGMVDDWSQELIAENRLIDFENMLDNMYGTGVWS